MVGFVWPRDEVEPRLLVSSRRSGTWSEWRLVPLMHDLPDKDDEEWHGRAGTQLVWIGPADGIRIKAEGRRPDGLTLVLMHPRSRDTDALAAAGPLARTDAGTTVVARPPMSGRAVWGADESWRNGGPRYNATIEQVHVHHTANSNDYTEDDVPALLRGIYRYHTHSLGWSDIAYNFLVDRFGRAWMGRAGGAARPVRGAHTLGFNATSSGIAVIGNYDLVAPSIETLDRRGEPGRVEAVHVRPGPGGHRRGDLGRQRQVRPVPGGGPARHRRAPRHQRHGLSRAAAVRPAARGTPAGPGADPGRAGAAGDHHHARSS